MACRLEAIRDVTNLGMASVIFLLPVLKTLPIFEVMPVVPLLVIASFVLVLLVLMFEVALDDDEALPMALVGFFIVFNVAVVRARADSSEREAPVAEDFANSLF